MDWVNKYIEAVRQHLPAQNRDDLAEEIESVVLDKIEAQEQRQGRPLSEPELLQLLSDNGHPRSVASAYYPPRALVPAEVFPDYLRSLKLTLCLVLGIVGGLMLLKFDFTPEAFSGRDLLRELLRIGVELGQDALLVFAIVTLAYSGAHIWRPVGETDQWDPAKTLNIVRPDSHIPLSSTFFEIALTLLLLALIHGFTPVPASVSYQGQEFAWRMSEPAQALVPWLTLSLIGFLALYALNLVRPYLDRPRLVAEIVLNVVFLALMLDLFWMDPLVSFSTQEPAAALSVNPFESPLQYAIRAAIFMISAVAVWDIVSASRRLWQQN